MVQSEELLFGKGSRKGEYQTKTRGSSFDAYKKSLQDNHRSTNRFSNHVNSKFPKNRKIKVSNPRSQGGRGGNSPMRNLLVPSVVRNICVIV